MFLHLSLPVFITPSPTQFYSHSYSQPHSYSHSVLLPLSMVWEAPSSLVYFLWSVSIRLLRCIGMEWDHLDVYHTMPSGARSGSVPWLVALLMDIYHG